MDELIAGRELDEQVMTALGLTMSQVVSVPPYSTDMNVAIQLLRYVSCVGFHAHFIDSEWDYCLDFLVGVGGKFTVWDESPALVICKALLITKGVIEANSQ